MKLWLASPHPDIATAAVVLTFGPSQLEALQQLLASDPMRVGFGLRLAITQRHEIGALRQVALDVHLNGHACVYRLRYTLLSCILGFAAVCCRMATGSTLAANQIV